MIPHIPVQKIEQWVGGAFGVQRMLWTPELGVGVIVWLLHMTSSIAGMDGALLCPYPWPTLPQANTQC